MTVRHELPWNVLDAELEDTLELARARHTRTYERRLARRREGGDAVTHKPSNARARMLEHGAGRLDELLEWLGANEHVLAMDAGLAEAAGRLAKHATACRDDYRDTARRLREGSS